MQCVDFSRKFASGISHLTLSKRCSPQELNLELLCLAITYNFPSLITSKLRKTGNKVLKRKRDNNYFDYAMYLTSGNSVIVDPKMYACCSDTAPIRTKWQAPSLYLMAKSSAMQESLKNSFASSDHYIAIRS